MTDGIPVIEQFRPGDHACAFIETREQHLALVSRFVGLGLGPNRKVIHILSGQNRDDFVQRLKAPPMNLSFRMETGQLALITMDEFSASDQRFDPEEFVAFLTREARRCRKEGFDAPWISMEMAWSPPATPDDAFFARYKKLLNLFFTQHDSVGLCLYDCRRFPSIDLLYALSCHPIIFIDTEPYKNPYYLPPTDMCSPNADRDLLDRRIEFLRRLKRPIPAIGSEPCLEENKSDFSGDRLLKTMLELIPNPAFYQDRDGLCRGCNTAFAEHLALPMDRIVGKTVHDIAPIENVDVYKQADDAMFANQGVQRYETKIRLVDGSERDAFFSRAIWPGSDGSAAGLICVMSDQVERKRAKAQCEEIRNAFRNMVDRFPDAIIIIEADGSIQHINPVAETMFRIQAKNLIGKKFGSSVEKIVDAEIQFVSFCGQMRLVEIRSFATIWDEKKSNILLLRDVTEQQRLQKTLELNEARLTAFYELYQKDFDTEKELVEFALDEAVRFSGSRIGYFHYVNKQQTHVDFFAWSAEIREKCRLVQQPQCRISDAGMWADAIRLGRPVIHNDYPKMIMKRGYPADHPEIRRHMSVPVLMDNLVVGVTGIANKENPYDEGDIRQMQLFMQNVWSLVLRRRDAEERRRLYMAIDQSPNIVMITDADGRIQFVNSTFTEITHYPKQAALGETPRILKSGRHDAAFYENLWNVIKAGHVWRGCIINKTRKGELFEADSVISPVKNKDGRAISYVCVMKDITEERRKEEQLRHSQKMEGIGQIAGGVSHDFNNMLQVIFGSIEFAMERIGPEDDIYEDLDEIRKAADRASELTRKLLAFSRRQVLSPVHMNLNDAVTDWLKMLRRVIPEHIAIQLIAGHHLGTVMADPVQIDQALMNICINARDAMPEGGRILIENQNVVLDDAYCRENFWAKPGRYVLMSVSDTGCGIPPEHLPHVFDPFYTTKGVGQGTGMGLAMVYGAITQHNGLVHIDSEVGKGTTVKIYLPITEQKASDVEKQIEGPVHGGDETLLVVEDDPQVRKMVNRILQSAGYHVLCAEDGGAALGILEDQGHEIRLALLDVVMPEMGGRELYDRIREQWPHIRTIFSSGYSNDAIHTSFILEDGLVLLPKPYNKEALLRKIREELNH